MCRQHNETLQKFLAATAKGYQFAAQHPEEAAELLCQTATDTALDQDMVKESMQLLSQVSPMLHYICGSGSHVNQGVTRRHVLCGNPGFGGCLGCIFLAIWFQIEKNGCTALESYSGAACSAL